MRYPEFSNLTPEEQHERREAAKARSRANCDAKHALARGPAPVLTDAERKQHRQEASRRWKQANRDKVNESAARHRARKGDQWAVGLRAWRRKKAAEDGRTMKDRRLPGTRTAEDAREQVNSASRAYRERDPERRKAIVLKHCRDKGYARMRERMQTVPHVRIAHRARCRIYMSLKHLHLGRGKKGRSIKLIGCTYRELATYIEGLFIPGMSWDRLFDGEIHLDHKKPCAAFDLTIEDQQKLCFHYTNLQPLWAKDNIAKGARLDWVRPMTYEAAA